MLVIDEPQVSPCRHRRQVAGINVNGTCITCYKHIDTTSEPYCDQKLGTQALAPAIEGGGRNVIHCITFRFLFLFGKAAQQSSTM
jgi:hypothetical protein